MPNDKLQPPQSSRQKSNLDTSATYALAGSVGEALCDKCRRVAIQSHQTEAKLFNRYANAPRKTIVRHHHDSHVNGTKIRYTMAREYSLTRSDQWAVYIIRVPWTNEPCLGYINLLFRLI